MPIQHKAQFLIQKFGSQIGRIQWIQVDLQSMQDQMMYLNHWRNFIEVTWIFIVYPPVVTLQPLSSSFYETHGHWTIFRKNNFEDLLNYI